MFVAEMLRALSVGTLVLAPVVALSSMNAPDEPDEVECNTCSPAYPVQPGQDPSFWLGSGENPGAAQRAAYTAMEQGFQDRYEDLGEDYECSICTTLPPSCEEYRKDTLDGVYSVGPTPVTGGYVYTITAWTADVQVCCSACEGW